MPEPQDEIVFIWGRERIFDLQIAAALYEHVLEDESPYVTDITQTTVEKSYACRIMTFCKVIESFSRKPLPLTCIELQNSGSRLLGLAPNKILDVGPCNYIFSGLLTDLFPDRCKAISEGIYIVPSCHDRPV